MRSSRKELPVEQEISEGTFRKVEWGSMTIETAEVRQIIDVTPLLKGLPDDRCQCPHWGYVIKGQIHCKYADHEEIFNTGDLYYMALGHTVVMEVGCEYIEFSPTDEYSKTLEVVERNLKAME
jgi:hypothetical protein